MKTQLLAIALLFVSAVSFAQPCPPTGCWPLCGPTTDIPRHLEFTNVTLQEGEYKAITARGEWYESGFRWNLVVFDEPGYTVVGVEPGADMIGTDWENNLQIFFDFNGHTGLHRISTSHFHDGLMCSDPLAGPLCGPYTTDFEFVKIIVRGDQAGTYELAVDRDCTPEPGTLNPYETSWFAFYPWNQCANSTAQHWVQDPANPCSGLVYVTASTGGPGTAFNPVVNVTAPGGGGGCRGCGLEKAQELFPNAVWREGVQHSTFENVKRLYR